MKIKLKNRLGVLIKDSGVKSTQEMSDRLAENQGVDIGRTSLSRKINDDNLTLTLSLIEAICNELQCLPQDLFETEISDATPEYVESLRSRVQPFRYGSIRMQRMGDEPSAPLAPVAADVRPQGAGRKAKVAPVDTEAIAGPSVRHMFAQGLHKPKA